jgi:hypothetical protein
MELRWRQKVSSSVTLTGTTGSGVPRLRRYSRRPKFLATMAEFLALVLGRCPGSTTGRGDQGSVVGLAGIRSTLRSTARDSENGNRLGRRRRETRPQARPRRRARRRPRTSCLSMSSAQPTSSGAGCEAERRRPSFLGSRCVVPSHPFVACPVSSTPFNYPVSEVPRLQERAGLGAARLADDDAGRSRIVARGKRVKVTIGACGLGFRNPRRLASV